MQRKLLGKEVTEEINDFGVHVTVHRNKFLIKKTTRCTNFTNLFLE